MSFKIYTPDDFNLPQCMDKSCDKPAHANSGIHQLCLDHYNDWCAAYFEPTIEGDGRGLLCAGCGLRFRNFKKDEAIADGWIIDPEHGAHCPGCEPQGD